MNTSTTQAAWRRLRQSIDRVLESCEPAIDDLFLGSDEAYVALIDTMDYLIEVLEEQRKGFSWFKVIQERERRPQ